MVGPVIRSSTDPIAPRRLEVPHGPGTLSRMTAFWTTRELRERGKSPRQIRRAVDDRVLHEVRKGHFARPDAAHQVVRAARIGGVATATTASRALGIWTPPDPPAGGEIQRGPRPPDRLRVAVLRNAARLRDPDDARRPLGTRRDVVLHWVGADDLSGTSRTRIAPPLLMLKHVFLSQPPERGLAVLDSALHLRFLRRTDLPALIRLLPARLEPVVMAAEPAAESGTETIVRYLLRARGLKVELIVGLRGIGTVDLLVEDRLIIEVDGREFHDDDEAFGRDRTRDLHAALQRYRVLRLRWSTVLFDWPTAEAAVYAALAS